MKSDHKKLGLLLICAAALYAAYLPAFPLGTLNDDAMYVVLAKSLWQGHYTKLSVSTLPPEMIHPPGYPLFLALFVPLFGSHGVLFQIVSILLTLGACWGVWLLAQRSTSPVARIAIPVLFALNPLLARISGSVMSEPLYIALEVTVFWTFAKCLESQDRRYLWVFSGVLTWTVMVRTSGSILLLAVWAALALTRNARRVWPWALIPGVVSGIWSLRNHQMVGETSGYLGYWGSLLPHFVANPEVLLDNVVRVSYLTFSYVVAGVELPHNAIGIAMTLVFALTISGLSVYGVCRWLSLKTMPQAWVCALALYVVLLFGMQATWTAIAFRYVIPLLPLLLLAMFEGLRWRKVAIGFFVVMGLSYAYLNVVLVGRTWAHPEQSHNPIPHITFDWMKKNLPAGSTVLYPSLDSLYLHTGFKGMGGIYATDRDHFLLRLRNENIQYALYQASRTLTIQGAKGPYNQGQVFAANQDWITSWPEAFTLIYMNEAERTALYQVRP